MLPNLVAVLIQDVIQVHVVAASLLDLVFRLAQVFKLNLVAWTLVDQLLRQHFYLHCDAPVFIREFQRIREEVKQDLHISLLVALNSLNQVQVGNIIDLSLQPDLILVRIEEQNLERLVNRVAEVEVAVV